MTRAGFHTRLNAKERLFVSRSPRCWRNPYHTCYQQAGCTLPPVPSELLRAGVSNRQCPCCPHPPHIVKAPWSRWRRQEGNKQQRREWGTRLWIKAAALMCVRLVLTSGLRCSLWQQRRAKQLPWCLGEVWEYHLLPAPPWHPGAWSSPPLFERCPHQSLWTPNKNSDTLWSFEKTPAS